MAKTAASHVSDRILQNPGNAMVHWEWGKLAGNYKPGDVVYESSKGVWTTRTASAGHLTRCGVVMDLSEIDPTTNARRTIDDAFAENDVVPICTSGIVVAKISDQNGAKLRGHKLIQATGEFTAASSGTAIWEAILCESVVDDDVYAKVGIGLFAYLGALLGGG